MNITKEMAIKSLRPHVEAWATRGELNESDILREQARLKSISLVEQKKIRRSAHPADVNDLAELVEELTGRILELERRLK